MKTFDERLNDNKRKIKKIGIFGVERFGERLMQVWEENDFCPCDVQTTTLNQVFDKMVVTTRHDDCTNKKIEVTNLAVTLSQQKGQQNFEIDSDSPLEAYLQLIEFLAAK